MKHCNSPTIQIWSRLDR